MDIQIAYVVLMFNNFWTYRSTHKVQITIDCSVFDRFYFRCIVCVFHESMDCIKGYKPWIVAYLLFQKPKNTLLNFFFTYFILCFIQIYLSKLIQNLPSFYRGGIDNPSYALGCKYFLFVCRYRLHSVAWFSYWIDTLVS